jgi:hypothetical protein
MTAPNPIQICRTLASGLSPSVSRKGSQQALKDSELRPLEFSSAGGILLPPQLIIVVSAEGTRRK